ncbi:hypothetical protein, partial [Klebsiella pneumoniae]
LKRVRLHNLALREESNADWLPKCDDPTAT